MDPRTRALHDHLDALEDLQLDAALELARRLGRLPRRGWPRLARRDTMAALSGRLALLMGRYLIPRAEAIALRTAARLSAAPSPALRQLQADLAAQDARREAELVSVLLTAEQARASVNALSTSLSETFEGIRGQISRLIVEVPPTTPEDASRLLDRIEAEVVEPLTPSKSAPTSSPIQGVLGFVAHDLGGEALTMAQVVFDRPKARPGTEAQAADDTLLTWVCALTSTCHDCLTRHGQTDTRANWRRRGRPRSGWSVCKRRCKCLLVPRFDREEGHADTIEPLQRAAMRLVDEGSPRGLTVSVPPALLREDPAALGAKTTKRERLKAAHAGSLRVRRAMRLLGSINAEEEGR